MGVLLGKVTQDKEHELNISRRLRTGASSFKCFHKCSGTLYTSWGCAVCVLSLAPRSGELATWNLRVQAAHQEETRLGAFRASTIGLPVPASRC
eukprot:457566-Amphidinium_carterae.1